MGLLDTILTRDHSPSTADELTIASWQRPVHTHSFTSYFDHHGHATCSIDFDDYGLAGSLRRSLSTHSSWEVGGKATCFMGVFLY